MNEKPTVDLAPLRAWIAKHGPVPAAQKAGLGRSTLLPFRSANWSPSLRTIYKIDEVMRRDAIDDVA